MADSRFLSCGTAATNDCRFREDSAEKLREFLRLNLRYGPDNLEDMRTGNMYHVGIDVILRKVTSSSIVHGVFAERDKVAHVLRDLEAAELGLSVYRHHECVSPISHSG